MKRREFIAALGGAAAWPLAAPAQQTTPVIGWLSTRSADDSGPLVAGFHRGLNDTGYIVRQNVAIEYRWAQNQFDRLPGMAAELVDRQVAVIVASGGEPSVFAAKAATSTIPTVFSSGADPVRLGFVASLNRPGGNATGVSIIVAELETKRLGLLRDLMPTPGAIAVLINPDTRNTESQMKDVQAAAHAMKQEILILTAGNDPSLDDAFATLIRHRAGALLITADPFFTSRREQLVAVASRLAIPAIYSNRDYAAAGGLVTYGPNFADAYRQMGVYTGKILKGARPADLPVVQSIKFELVINLRTAKALGLTLPSGLLSIADEVIE